MTKNINEDLKKLLQNGYTCVLLCEGKQYVSFKRGVKPLIEWYNQGISGGRAADKVVGRAAALLYVLLKVEYVFTPVISKGAKEIFELFGINFDYLQETEYIINRKKDGICPMEQATIKIDDPYEGYKIICNKLTEL